MGIGTTMRMEAWQQEAGLQPATPRDTKDLRKIQKEAFELIKVIELKISGIRDGDGCWCGSDVIGGTFRDLADLLCSYVRRRDEEWEKANDPGGSLSCLPT